LITLQLKVYNLTNKKFRLVMLYRTPPTNEGTVAGTGSTVNYVSTSTPHTNNKIAIDPIEVTISNDNTVTSIHPCKLYLPSLLKTARQVHIFPHLPAGALLSIGLLCNTGFTTNFDTYTLRIQLKGKTIFTGTRSTVTKLWCINSTPTTPPVLPTTVRYAYATQTLTERRSVFRTTSYATVANFVIFLHDTLGNPALFTLCKVMDTGHITSCPDLTSNLVRKYLLPISGNGPRSPWSGAPKHLINARPLTSSQTTYNTHPH